MRTAIIAFVPVLHDGYRKFFERHRDAEALFLLSSDTLPNFEYLKKEIRALDPHYLIPAIEAWGLFKSVQSLSPREPQKIIEGFDAVVMPDEDISREYAKQYCSGKNVIFDSVFLRWDKYNSIAETPVSPDSVITTDEFDRSIMMKAFREAEKSSDFWRHVGAAFVKDGTVVSIAHNSHVPSEHSPYASGDPRNAFKRGLNIEISTSIHAEAKIIAEAAQKGIALAGAEMYVTTFPCPPCAKLIAFSGIKKLYVGGGYGVLDGEIVLKAKGVEIIYVEGAGEKVSGAWEGYKKL